MSVASSYCSGAWASAFPAVPRATGTAAFTVGPDAPAGAAGTARTIVEFRAKEDAVAGAAGALAAADAGRESVSVSYRTVDGGDVRVVSVTAGKKGKIDAAAVQKATTAAGACVHACLLSDARAVCPRFGCCGWWACCAACCSALACLSPRVTRPVCHCHHYRQPRTRCGFSVSKLRALKVTRAEFVLPDGVKDASAARVAGAITQAAALANYAFDRYLTAEDKVPTFLDSVHISGPASGEADVADAVRKAAVLAQGVIFARDCSNERADEMHPGRMEVCAWCG
jgi:hypothetical protein